jgi:hypothetical protein
MHKNATKCNKTQSNWCINKHAASKIIDTFETYQTSASASARHGRCNEPTVLEQQRRRPLRTDETLLIIPSSRCHSSRTAAPSPSLLEPANKESPSDARRSSRQGPSNHPVSFSLFLYMWPPLSASLLAISTTNQGVGSFSQSLYEFRKEIWKH